MYLADLADFDGRNPKVKTFAHITLKSGEEVAFHIHENESESYYILKGNGVYSDNGKETEIISGTATFTPSGSGHGMKNTSDEDLEFIALIIED